MKFEALAMRAHLRAVPAHANGHPHRDSFQKSSLDLFNRWFATASCPSKYAEEPKRSKLVDGEPMQVPPAFIPLALTSLTSSAPSSFPPGILPCDSSRLNSNLLLYSL
jgi:hypothetical protein